MDNKHSHCSLRRLSTLVGLLLMALVLSGCIGKGYSIPGFGSKKDPEADAQNTNLVSEPEVEPTDELNHVANNDIRLGQSSDQINVTGQNDETSDNSVQNVSLTNWDEEKIDEWFESSPNKPTEPSADDIILNDKKISDYQGILETTEQSGSNLAALRASLKEMNESSEWAQEHNAGTARISDADWENDQVFEEQFDLEGAVADTAQPVDEEFPWATPRKTAKPVVDRVKGIINQATILTQESTKYSSQKISETAKSVIEKTQSVLTPETVTAEQVLAEIEARQGIKSHHAPENQVSEDQLQIALQRIQQELRNAEIARNSGRPQDALRHTIVAGELAKHHQLSLQKIQQLSMNQKNLKQPSTTDFRPVQQRQGQSQLPVVIDLSREWVNTPRRSSRPEDAIEQFAVSTVTANQPAELPVVTPHSADAQVQPSSLPHDPDQQNLDSGTAAESQQDVIQLGGLNQNSEMAQLVANSDEAPVFAPSSPQLNLSADSDDAPAFHLTDPIAETTSQSSHSSVPILLAPGSDSNNQPETSNAEEDEFAAAFKDVTVQQAPEIDDAPLLIDESELQLDDEPAHEWTANHLTFIICGLALLAMLILRWRL